MKSNSKKENPTHHSLQHGEECEICHPKKHSTLARAQIEELRGKISDLISKNPDKAAIILTQWLSAADTAQKKKSNKKAA